MSAIFAFGLLLFEGFAQRADGPCSDWFNNAWTKSQGHSADVCCWYNSTECWQGQFTFASCCADFDTTAHDVLLSSLGHAPAALSLAHLALSENPRLASSASGPAASIDGQLLASDGVSAGVLGASEYASPRDFFRAIAPGARLALALAEEASGLAGVDHSTVHGGNWSDSVELVLIIMTAPGNFARRRAMRRSWLQMLSQGRLCTRFTFAIGAPDQWTLARSPAIVQELVSEQAEFGDLLFLRCLRDVYWGWEHTAKTFLAVTVALARAPRAKHFALLHDDVFVHVPRLLELLAAVGGDGNSGMYLGNAYSGHDFVGHSASDGPTYQQLHGHRTMPIVMKGGLWVIDLALARWVAAMLGGPAGHVPWRLWPSDDDSVALAFAELDVDRLHVLRHGREWFDWRLGDRCDGENIVIAHDLKTPRELHDIWGRHVVFGDPCFGHKGGVVRWSSRPRDFF